MKPIDVVQLGRRRTWFAVGLDTTIACVLAGAVSCAASPIGDFASSRFAPTAGSIRLYTDPASLPPDAPERVYSIVVPTHSVVTTGGPNRL